MAAGLGEGVSRRLSMPISAARARCQGAGILAMDFGIDTFAKRPNPVDRVHPGVGHARKPGDPFLT